MRRERASRATIERSGRVYVSISRCERFSIIITGEDVSIDLIVYLSL